MKNFDIGITGLAGSGKDTIADIICKHFNYRKLSFAAALKNFCSQAGWDGNKDEAGRKLLQDVGMAFRIYKPNTWVELISSHIEPGVNYVFPDVRFLNEVEYLNNNRNGLILRVVRPSLELTLAHAHVSESGQKDLVVHHTVMNDHSIEELEKAVIELISKEIAKAN
jgi:hypothetical protein